MTPTIEAIAEREVERIRHELSVSGHALATVAATLRAVARRAQERAAKMENVQ